MSIRTSRRRFIELCLYQVSCCLPATHLLFPEPLAEFLELQQQLVNLQLPHNVVATSEQAVIERPSLSSLLWTFGLADPELSLHLLLLHRHETTCTTDTEVEFYSCCLRHYFRNSNTSNLHELRFSRCPFC